MHSSTPRVVVTIHGIRTHGKWQKRVTPYLARHGLVPYHIDYGWFGSLAFVFRPTRDRRVQAIREELRLLVEKAQVQRLSIIAHSFGTFIALEILERENGNLVYDRVVLTGSIVRRDFDWKGAVAKNRVRAVINERARRDGVAKLAGWISSNRVARFLSGNLKAGRSGVEVFDQRLPQMIDRELDGGHSEVHNETKFESWARFIAYPHLPPDVLERVRPELQVLRQTAAQMLQIDSSLVRANLFAPLGGALRIVPDAHDNMHHAPELELKIALGHGGTGSAFQSGDPLLVLKRGLHWTGHHLPADELVKLHPDLRWVISLPIRSADRDIVVAIVNIDGLDAIPPGLDQSDEDCKAVIVALQFAAQERLMKCLEPAWRGERLAILED